jgi:hypothetical protein
VASARPRCDWLVSSDWTSLQTTLCGTAAFLGALWWVAVGWVEPEVVANAVAAGTRHDVRPRAATHKPCVARRCLIVHLLDP